MSSCESPVLGNSRCSPPRGAVSATFEDLAEILIKKGKQRKDIVLWACKPPQGKRDISLSLYAVDPCPPLIFYQTGSNIPPKAGKRPVGGPPISRLFI